jgi:hypothetical protein
VDEPCESSAGIGTLKVTACLTGTNRRRRRSASNDCVRNGFGYDSKWCDSIVKGWSFDTPIRQVIRIFVPGASDSLD